MSRRPFLFAAAVLVLLTLFLTWPQCLFLATKLANHDDSYFSAWRIGWIAHALRTDPRHLFDGNIFYPERRTLAFSDATLLEGIVATPFLWMGLSPALLYNMLLLGGIAASGLGMFVLVRHLTRNDASALVAGAIFVLLPYRVLHYPHLELQWTVWMPLAFWAVHRTVEEQSWRFGVLTGVLVWLQVVSSVYYGIFLAPMVAVLAILLLVFTKGNAVVRLAALAAGAVVAALLTYPYALPYLENARTLSRTTDDVRTYSASLLSYLAAPASNWIWGWTGRGRTGDELSLFPGVVSVALAVVGLADRPRKAAGIYAALALLAFLLSLGFNGPLYPWLFAHVSLLSGLRAPARFSILAFCSLAVLAGYGVDRLQRRFPSARARAGVAAAALAAVALESGSAPMKLEPVPRGTPEIYWTLRQLPAGVLVELPTPTPPALAGVESTYSFWSTTHWRPLVNGYSGFTTPGYSETMVRMRTFPDDASIARLRNLDVRYVLVHEHLYDPDKLTDLLDRIVRRRELIPKGRYRDWTGATALFELER